MGKIKAFTQDQEYSHPYGDLLAYRLKDYLRRAENPKSEEIDNFTPLMLPYIGANTWEALKKLSALDQKFFAELESMSKYMCPYTQKEYTAVVPLYIWTNSPDHFLEDVYVSSKDMVCDAKWNRRHYADQLFKGKLTKIQSLLLGSGHTSCELMSDGSNSIEYAAMDLENSDKIIFAVYVWHNK